MRTAAFLLMALLLLAAGGCSVVPDWAGGGPDYAEVVTDGERDHEETVSVGQRLVVDMFDPRYGDEKLAGVIFDPEILLLDGVVEDGRIRYEFVALKPGQTDVEVRVKEGPSEAVSVYKRVSVTVEE